ncbi:RecX family transcriptional regulator [Christensenellaceae bacterium OttesenSCG-928-K19]|nr:RecX family transcriptional regulator [Christensenellaceae bacterium OttesenSCG-928-K19]
MVITEVAQGKRNKDRLNIYIDDKFSFACYIETAVKHRLKKGVEVTQALIDSIREEDGQKYAFDTALKFVSRKMRTQKEIEDKLREKEVDEAQIVYAVGKLIEYGYIDDRHYAELYVSELCQKYGVRMIKQKLAQKGIKTELIKELPIDAEPALEEHLQKLYRRYEQEEPAKKKQKIIRALLQKGFEYDEIKGAMKGIHED